MTLSLFSKSLTKVFHVPTLEVLLVIESKSFLWIKFFFLQKNGVSCFSSILWFDTGFRLATHHLPEERFTTTKHCNYFIIATKSYDTFLLFQSPKNVIVELQPPSPFKRNSRWTCGMTWSRKKSIQILVLQFCIKIYWWSTEKQKWTTRNVRAHNW